MQDKDLTPNSNFLTLNTTKTPSKTTQKGRVFSANNTLFRIDNQQLMAATETPYTYDSVKAFKKLDNKIKKLGH